MESNLEGVFAAIFIPSMLGGVAIGILVFLYKSRARKLDTLVRIIELGGNVEPETIRALSTDSSNYKNDFRSGLIWLAVGIPLSIGMYFDEGIGAAIFGLVPVLIGIAHLISGKYRWRES